MRVKRVLVAGGAALFGFAFGGPSVIIAGLVAAGLGIGVLAIGLALLFG